MKQTHTRKNFILILMTVTFSCYTHAEDILSYNYLEFGLVHNANAISAVDLNSSSKGLFAKGSFDISKHFYWGAFIDRNEISRFDLNATQFGFFSGVHKRIKPNIDFYSEINIFRESVSTIGLDINAVELGAGLRAMVSDNFELDGSLGINKPNDIDNYWNYGVEASYYLSANKSLRLKLEQVNSDFVSQFGFRFSF